jgi:hypothetical protein
MESGLQGKSAQVFEIPSAAKAALIKAACGGTKVPPFQNGDLFRASLGNVPDNVDRLQ